MKQGRPYYALYGFSAGAETGNIDLVCPHIPVPGFFN